MACEHQRVLHPRRTDAVLHGRARIHDLELRGDFCHATLVHTVEEDHGRVPDELSHIVSCESRGKNQELTALNGRNCCIDCGIMSLDRSGERAGRLRLPNGKSIKNGAPMLS